MLFAASKIYDSTTFSVDFDSFRLYMLKMPLSAFYLE